MNLFLLSKTLSHALRHAPETYGITLGPDGWVDVETLLVGIRKMKPALAEATAEDIAEALRTATKKRHELKDGQIRALYGHSAEVAMDLQSSAPPAILFHGTTRTAYVHIKRQGLLPMKRQYVHLAEEPAAAILVGQRHKGTLLLLQVDAQAAHAAGVQFFQTETVWLATPIPSAYLTPVEADH